MHYIFDSTGTCVITAQSPIEPIDGYTSFESTEVYNPWEIRLVDGAIVKQEPKEKPTEEHPQEEQGDTPLPPSVEDLAESVAGLYELLASVVPPSEEESEGKHE
ncbi:hypothetical protein [Veillonella sp. 3310]|uniref:hypothetical protein n=1 Tax=Veillonella sp. 3310 TaxID=2490956 RepID=UPI000FD64F5E|nr:hypothetical protein [Veillonella sp. 3310]